MSEEFEAEFPVENIDENASQNAPVHNLAMENFCGLVGHRTSKSKTLESTSRSIIIQGTKKLMRAVWRQLQGLWSSCQESQGHQAGLEQETR